MVTTSSGCISSFADDDTTSPLTMKRPGAPAAPPSSPSAPRLVRLVMVFISQVLPEIMRNDTVCPSPPGLAPAPPEPRRNSRWMNSIGIVASIISTGIAATPVG